ncbi:Hypothetical predicted protein [Octopus vulgaris]|uniref:Uncharacterized protein n=1 Tax=Octopus vulgaris TaxID=6645 RepID=A0AA36F1M6_OCTVU|nr:Hypothetical predicted protein [Octopus vulgaris]
MTLLADEVCDAESLLYNLERAAKDVTTTSGKSLKYIDEFIYLTSKIAKEGLSTSDVHIRIGKVWATLDYQWSGNLSFH